MDNQTTSSTITDLLTTYKNNNENLGGIAGSLNTVYDTLGDIEVTLSEKINFNTTTETSTIFEKLEKIKENIENFSSAYSNGIYTIQNFEKYGYFLIDNENYFNLETPSTGECYWLCKVLFYVPKDTEEVSIIFQKNNEDVKFFVGKTDEEIKNKLIVNETNLNEINNSDFLHSSIINNTNEEGTKVTLSGITNDGSTLITKGFHYVYILATTSEFSSTPLSAADVNRFKFDENLTFTDFTESTGGYTTVDANATANDLPEETSAYSYGGKIDGAVPIIDGVLVEEANSVSLSDDIGNIETGDQNIINFTENILFKNGSHLEIGTLDNNGGIDASETDIFEAFNESDPTADINAQAFSIINNDSDSSITHNNGNIIGFGAVGTETEEGGGYPAFGILAIVDHPNDSGKTQSLLKDGSIIQTIITNTDTIDIANGQYNIFDAFGDALPSNVAAGIRFTSASGFYQTGTATMQQVYTPEPGDISVVVNDNIGSFTYSAYNQILPLENEISVTIPVTGKYRFKWSIATFTSKGGYSQLYKKNGNNETLIGEKITTSNTGLYTYSQEIDCNAGDIICIYGCSGNPINLTRGGRLSACVANVPIGDVSSSDTTPPQL